MQPAQGTYYSTWSWHFPPNEHVSYSASLSAMCKMNWQPTQWSVWCSWPQCHQQSTCSNKNQVSGTLWCTLPHKNQSSTHTHAQSNPHACNAYTRRGQRLGSAELETGWTKGGKACFWWVACTLPAFPRAKMTWCNFTITVFHFTQLCQYFFGADCILLVSMKLLMPLQRWEWSICVSSSGHFLPILTSMTMRPLVPQ